MRTKFHEISKEKDGNSIFDPLIVPLALLLLPRAALRSISWAAVRNVYEPVP